MKLTWSRDGVGVSKFVDQDHTERPDYIKASIFAQDSILFDIRDPSTISNCSGVEHLGAQYNMDLVRQVCIPKFISVDGVRLGRLIAHRLPWQCYIWGISKPCSYFFSIFVMEITRIEHGFVVVLFICTGWPIDGIFVAVNLNLE